MPKPTRSTRGVRKATPRPRSGIGLPASGPAKKPARGPIRGGIGTASTVRGGIGVAGNPPRVSGRNTTAYRDVSEKSRVSSGLAARMRKAGMKGRNDGHERLYLRQPK